MKKFVLVVIPVREELYHSFRYFASISIPGGIIAIAAMLEQIGYSVKIIDANAENLTFEETLERVLKEQPDYVGSTTITATMDITYSFYSKLKEKLPEIKIILGGHHVSALPKKTLEESQDIDIVVKGEGEETIVELMDVIEHNKDLSTVKGIAFRKDGNIVDTANRELIKDLAKLPIPAYHLLKFNMYRPYGWSKWVKGYKKPFASLFIGRGCYGKCNFCSVHIIFGRCIRYFPIERVKKEIDLLVNKYKVRSLCFEDPIFTANKKMVNKICDYIIHKSYNKRLIANYGFFQARHGRFSYLAKDEKGRNSMDMLRC